ncbi:hypothetical protein Nepgr_033023 [Nepenthes gracilis]|uniref:Uncharacterized protein n=1 Tax=Nepenthes gracilis TaxID=150966 RepID=A0AAD3TKG1_NEPGR|nr:hypothetical protein Nepgr_033023 [Nepenthes gracilis]
MSLMSLLEFFRWGMKVKRFMVLAFDLQLCICIDKVEMDIIWRNLSPSAAINSCNFLQCCGRNVQTKLQLLLFFLQSSLIVLFPRNRDLSWEVALFEIYLP